MLTSSSLLFLSSVQVPVHVTIYLYKRLRGFPRLPGQSTSTVHHDTSPPPLPSLMSKNIRYFQKEGLKEKKKKRKKKQRVSFQPMAFAARIMRGITGVLTD